jgi:hypothetical protein
MTAMLRFFAFLLAFLALCAPAYAYLDPVTGSVAVQGIIALVAGIVAGVKGVRTWIAGALRSLLRRKDA